MEFGFAVGEKQKLGVGHDDLMEPVGARPRRDQCDAVTVGEKFP